LGLAGRCLQACGLTAPAAELAIKAGNHSTALRMLLAAKEHAAAAACCLDGAAEALRQHAVHQRQHAVLDAYGGTLLDPLAAPPAGTHAAAAAASRARALAWLAKAVEQVYLAKDLETLTGLLAPSVAAAGGGRGSVAADSEDDEAADERSSTSGASAATEMFAPLRSELHDMLKRRWAGSYGLALRRVVLRCNAKREHARARRVAGLIPVEAERDKLLARMGYWRELARLKRQTDPLGAVELLLDHRDFAYAARLISEYIASKAPTSTASKQPTKGKGTVGKTVGDGVIATVSALAATWAPVDERAWDLLHRCVMAQTEPETARRLRLQLDRWAITAPEDSFFTPTASTAVGNRMLVCKGHAALLEARLILQRWASAGAGYEEMGAGEQHQLPRPSPASWEQIGSDTAPAASESSSSALVTWETAMPLLHEAAKCFKRCGHWLGHLEALALMLQFGPESDAMTEVALAQVPMGTSAQQMPVPGDAAAATAAAANSPGLQKSEAVTSLMHVAQATMAALRKQSPTRLATQQQQHLAALEQLYGLPGLSQWCRRLPIKHATHVWWAILGPERVAAGRSAVQTPQTGGAVGAAGATASPRTAPATVAAQHALKPMGQ
ncbi:hypothetical protein VaNZ11_011867, partial [Volvox africanus]